MAVMDMPVRPRLATLGSGMGVLAAENVRGYEVRDANNRLAGKVEDLVLDVEQGRVRFLKVGSGGFLGMGRVHRLIPVDVVKEVAGEYVFLDRTKDQIEGAPAWRPIDDASYVDQVLRYFDCRPFWSSDYHHRDWAASTGR